MRAYGLTAKGSRKLIMCGSDCDLIITRSKRNMRTHRIDDHERIVCLEIKIVPMPKPRKRK